MLYCLAIGAGNRDRIEGKMFIRGQISADELLKYPNGKFNQLKKV